MLGEEEMIIDIQKVKLDFIISSNDAEEVKMLEQLKGMVVPRQIVVLERLTPMPDEIKPMVRIRINLEL